MYYLIISELITPGRVVAIACLCFLKTLLAFSLYHARDFQHFWPFYRMSISYRSAYRENRA